MDIKSEKRTDNLGRMKALITVIWPLFFVRKAGNWGMKRSVRSGLDLNMVLMVSYDAHKQ